MMGGGVSDNRSWDSTALHYVGKATLFAAYVGPAAT
jgi:hypothetical protein